ncbi:hypothetical protein J2X46_002409 [Nocardioides sp. BE266]|uniref:hypothetical protein n=1 Tax=Nocardioides sp. BE266 TaxID=2817725 RepID=UPI00285FA144|nr:hypothetical protein [Nocardioides sp. BE266]MDR7253424.1 hypothetical protein [Nocardioides sp. BE266]
MRWLVAPLALMLAGCAPPWSDDEPDDTSGSVQLVTRPEGRNDSTWDEDTGTMRVEAGCVLFKGQLTAFPYGTRVVDDGAAIQLDEDSAPVALDGRTEVYVTGSEVPLGEDGDWDHAMDRTNLERWDECRRRVAPSPYADWWQVTGFEATGS